MMMTSFAFISGLVPLVWAHGAPARMAARPGKRRGVAGQFPRHREKAGH
jgi:hypothetical protein